MIVEYTNGSEISTLGECAIGDTIKIEGEKDYHIRVNISSEGVPVLNLTSFEIEFFKDKNLLIEKVNATLIIEGKEPTE